MNEAELNVLVERHREAVPMSIPPTGLLRAAQHERSRRRRRTTALTVGVALAIALVAAGIHALSATPAPDSAAPPPAPRSIVPTVSGPSMRLVGLNGWAVRIPGSWGTDLVGCDGRTAVHPTVTFNHHLPNRPPCEIRSDAPNLYISDGPVPRGLPWDTISGVRVQEQIRPGSTCRTCLTLGIPSAGVIFAIHARTDAQLDQIETSLQPLSDRQITIPVWRDPTGRAPLDQMARISQAEGLRPQIQEVPSARRPGRFLRSNPPLGTPVDLGRGVTLVYSAGDLGRVATPGSLRDHGWVISPSAAFSPPLGRDTATRIAGRPGLGTDAFLRDLTVTHEGPRTVRFRTRLAWLVLTSRGSDADHHLSSITAVDATTGHVLEVRTGFRGRSS